MMHNAFMPQKEKNDCLVALCVYDCGFKYYDHDEQTLFRFHTIIKRTKVS